MTHMVTLLEWIAALIPSTAILGAGRSMACMPMIFGRQLLLFVVSACAMIATASCMQLEGAARSITFDMGSPTSGRASLK